MMSRQMGTMISRRSPMSGLKPLPRVRALPLLLWGVLLLWSAPLAAQVSVEHVHWGFDGRGAVHQFTPLAVLLKNSSSVPTEVKVTLRKRAGFQPVDALMEETAYLSPGSARWVRFYPYVTEMTSDMTLTLGDQFSTTVPVPRMGRHQRVLLDDGNNFSNETAIVKLFPEQLFPPFVTATDGLQAVFVDHVPRWEEPQRRAFLDWLQKGGHVIVLQDVAGRFPKFAGDLAVLNTPVDEEAYGSGTIHKLNLRRQGLSRVSLFRLFRNLPGERIIVSAEQALELTDIDRVELQRVLREDQDASKQSNYGGQYGNSDLLAAQRFLPELKLLSRPEHLWLLLHLLFWMYIAIVFPGAYIVGQLKSVDYRWVFGMLGGAIVIFSGLFAMTGRRGYGEQSTVYTVALIRPLRDGAWDITGFSNFFVTTGGNYTIRHAGEGLLYSSCQDLERVPNGVLHSGTSGEFRAEIPPYSSREFAHRARLPAKPFDVTLSSVQAGEKLADLTIALGSHVPPAFKSAYVMYGRDVYSVVNQGQSLKLGHSLGTIAAFMGVDQSANTYPYSAAFGRSYGAETNNDQRLDGMAAQLLAVAVGVGNEQEAKRDAVPPGVVRLCVVGELPPEIAPTTDLGRNLGRAMWVFDFPVTGAPTP